MHLLTKHPTKIKYGPICSSIMNKREKERTAWGEKISGLELETEEGQGLTNI